MVDEIQVITSNHKFKNTKVILLPPQDLATFLPWDKQAQGSGFSFMQTCLQTFQ